MPPEYKQLMQLCWQQEPAKRPAIKDVIHALRMCQMQQSFASFSFDGVNLKEDAPEVGDEEGYA